MNRFISIIIIKSWLTEETDHKFPNQSKDHSLYLPAQGSALALVLFHDQIRFPCRRVTKYLQPLHNYLHCLSVPEIVTMKTEDQRKTTFKLKEGVKRQLP